MLKFRYALDMSTTFDFTIFSITGLIVFAAYFSGGLIDSVCGGGGLITVPVLVSIGMPSHTVIGTNQCSLIPGCATSLYKYTKSGNMDIHVALLALPFSLIGALIGARLNMLMSERCLQVIMLFLIPAIAAASLLKKDIGEHDFSKQVSKRNKIIGAATIGLLISAYHAFYGPASGMFYMICFTVFLKFNLLKANGVSRFLVAAASLISSFSYAFSGFVCWKAVLVAAIAYIFGNYAGVNIALSRGSKFVRPIYYCTLTLLFLKLITDFF